MVTMEEVLNQFRRLGVKPSPLARGEIKELPNILAPGERLHHVVMGWYDGGLALLCTTNHRVLLIDKKLFFLTVEDLRYDMVAEVRYQYRLLDAAVSLTYSGRTLEFKSWSQGLLRKLVGFIQGTITDIETARSHINDQPEEKISVPAEPQPTTFYASAPKQAQIETFPIEHYEQPAYVQSNWPRNPYKTGTQILRRHKLSRFVTQTQLSR